VQNVHYDKKERYFLENTTKGMV